MARRGLDKAIAAGMVCKEAERLYPELFQAVSLRAGILTVTAPLSQRLDIKMIEGKLILELAEYSKPRNLPTAERVIFRPLAD